MADHLSATQASAFWWKVDGRAAKLLELDVVPHLLVSKQIRSMLLTLQREAVPVDHSKPSMGIQWTPRARVDAPSE